MMEVIKRELEELTQLCCEGHKIISIVGAGGKTTLMYELAGRCAARGRAVLVSTTTHIAPPASHFAESPEEAVRLWESGAYAVVGKRTPEGKLAMLPEAELESFISRADLVFLEADGSKRRPCKVPEAYEPVILPETSLVIGVMGMSCLGERLSDCCFRLDTAARRFGVSPEDRMTEELAVRILSSEAGTRKSVGGREYAVVLNQCDTPKIRAQAERIAQGLKEKGVCRVFLTCLI